MDECEARVDAFIAGGGATASIALFWVVYGPAMLSAPLGTSFRAMALLPLLAFIFGYGWWVMCIGMGVRLLFVRPRRYGWITVGLGALQFAAVPLAVELLMQARGIQWGS